MRASIGAPALWAGAQAEGNIGSAMDTPLEEATLDQLGAALRAQRTSALALVRAYGARIDSIDRAGPSLRSVIEFNPEAEAIAQTLDAEARSGRWRGPLHGVPVLV